MTGSSIPQSGFPGQKMWPSSPQAAQVTLDQILTLSLQDLAGLETGDLKRLHEEADQDLARAKRIKAFLEGAIDHRFGGPVTQLRQAEGKPTGVIRLNEGEFVVISDLPKRPEWDQEKLTAIAEEIRRDGVDPANYLDMEYKVQERRFTAWPPHIQAAFSAARTLKVGKPTYKIERAKSQGGF